jgi:glycosyltransferase involved in cell wall biosynthesis/putative flippase GtrA
MDHPLHVDLPLPNPLPPTVPVVDVAMPVYNEQAVLATSIERLHGYLTDHFPFRWRITIVDNASTDDTPAIAADLASRLDGVRSVRLERKGRGLALREVWSNSDAAVVAYMDIDLSTGLDALLPLVAPLVTGHSDMAIGSRLAAGASVARGPRREIISRSYNAILRVVFANRFRDAQCGFKAIRTDIARLLLPEVRDDGWFFDTELLLLAEHNGLRVHEVPVDWVDDPDSKVNVTRTARDDLKGVWRMARSFLRGGGKVDLGALQRAPLREDFGRQLVSFALVGAVSTTASLMLFLALHPAMHPIAANIVALAATAIANAWANRRFTFGHRSRVDRGQHYLAAATMLATSIGVSSGALALCLWAGGDLLAQSLTLVAAWGLTAVGRFALLRAWVFRAPPAELSGRTVLTRA